MCPGRSAMDLQDARPILGLSIDDDAARFLVRPGGVSSDPGAKWMIGSVNAVSSPAGSQSSKEASGAPAYMQIRLTVGAMCAENGCSNYSGRHHSSSLRKLFHASKDEMLYPCRLALHTASRLGGVTK